jgi:hypothetical protein
MHKVENLEVESIHVQQANNNSLYKDAVLNELGNMANVAQFISFGPNLEQRYARLRGHSVNFKFGQIEIAISELLKVAPENSVNVRSFMPEDPKSREFVYGLNTTGAVTATVQRLASEGLYTIVNETVDVNDGGVSGVVLGNVMEFAPGDTPRCVEKPGTVSLPLGLGSQLLELIYGFQPTLNYESNMRVEFSIHPLRRGFRYDHTIVWEIEDVGNTEVIADTRWPNLFSRLIGDKVFGLLVAHMLKLRVPHTTVISRALPPFTFGEKTGTSEPWIRTSPTEQVPGQFTTQRGWRDPFKLMVDEDPSGNALSSIISQEGVEAVYSGALVASPEGIPIIEGVRGSGDEFMLGRVAPQTLPQDVLEAVNKLYNKAKGVLGPVRLEWVFDGHRAWIVQLHKGATVTSGRTIYPGEVSSYREFKISEGINALRALISKVAGTGEGIVLVGNVGVTSHLGDILRRAKIPSFIKDD